MRHSILATLLALSLVAAACSGGSPKTVVSPSQTGSGEPTAQTTAETATTSPTPAPAASAVNGVPVQTLQLGASVSLPAGVVAYYFLGGYAKDGGPTELRRIYRDATGTVHLDSLLEPLGQYGTPYWQAFDLDHGLVAVAVCARGYCGGYGAPSSDAQSKLFTSGDGGVSWTERGDLPRDTFVAAVAPGELILNTWSFETQAAPRFWRFPSGETVDGPAGFAPEVVPGAGLVWMRSGEKDSEIRAWSGEALARTGLEGSALQPSRFVASATGQPFRFRSWITASPSASDEPVLHHMIAMQDSQGHDASVFVWEGRELWPTIQIGATRLLGNVYPPQDGFGDFPPAVFDLAERLIHPIDELSREKTRSNAFIITAQVGSFARVKTGSDCLNARETPSRTGTALGCLRDGVLLRVRPQPERVAEGMTWISVETPDGRAGWASGEFLERLPIQ